MINISEALIKVITTTGISVEVYIYPNQENTLSEINSEEISKYGEAKYQLSEGCSYEYWLSDSNYQLISDGNVIKHFRIKERKGGSIIPNTYTGTLRIHLVDIDNNSVGTFELEVRSIKTGYRDDYRVMLQDITERSTELLMQHSSPSVMNFSTDYDSDGKVSYQRFSFIKSIILSEEFKESVHRITSSPVVKWDNEVRDIDIRNVGRIKSYEAKQIASSSRRIKFSGQYELKSLPVKINTSIKRESIDTLENRFIKHVLESINYFVSSVRTKFNENSIEEREALDCENILEEFLSHSIFKEISRLQHLSLNSPVLQRKEGYREVYKAWLMFDLAAKLDWAAGEDIYKAGKRNVADLYEYWLFFQLLDIIEDLFNLESIPADELINMTDDGIGLKLKSGVPLKIEGIYISSGRKLKVRYSYNRSYSGNSTYPEGGSWSVPMRPDYSISIWPSEFSETEAEKQELMLHIHFDAKYKVAGYKDLFTTSYDNKIDGEVERIEVEELESKRRIYKRVDILKMHSYKDAIRRTAGAYVLYPGTEDSAKKGYHDLIPGLGSFAIRPSKYNTGISKLKTFIKDVLENYMLQNSKHEKLSYHRFNIYNNEPKDSLILKEPIPERYGSNRNIPPSEISVLIGYINEKQFDWVSNNNKYNIRIDLPITPQMAGARYIVLWNEIDCDYTNRVFRIISNPRLESYTYLKNSGYEDPSQDQYFIYDIVNDTELLGKDKKFNLPESFLIESDNELKRPFSISLEKIMQRVRKAPLV